MFATIARFELRYQFRNPVFWVATIMFFLLTLGWTSVESIRPVGGNIHTNAPTGIAQVLLTMSMFFMFVTTAFVGNVVVRDDETGFGSIIRSTKVGKLPYLFGRFTGAFLGAAVAFLAVPLALWLGTFMPWVNPDLIGPNRLQDYVFAYFVIALPNVLITSAIFFAIASWTRSVTYSYLAVIVSMFAYFALTAMMRKMPDVSLAAYFEPFGSVAYGLGVRYLTPIQQNTQALELTGMLASHRLLWIAISVAIVGFVVWRFRFAARGASKASAKRDAAHQQKLAAIQPVLVDRLPENTPERGAWHQLVTRTRLEMKLVFKSPAFWVLALIGSINLMLTLMLAGRMYDVPIWPRTYAIIDTVRGGSTLITLLMAIYFSGEVVWRERERRISEIVDATPLPNWVFLVSKLAGVVGVLFALSVLAVLLQAVAYQFVRGVTDVELGQWLMWFVIPSALYVIHLSVLAIVAQAVSPNKFVGWGIMLLYLISTIVFAGLGFDHPLINYGDAPMPLSEMNGNDYMGATAWWLSAYWTAFAAVLVVIGHLMWRRGTAVTLGGQWRTLPLRLRGAPLAYLSVALAVTVGIGTLLFYNMNIVNTRFDEDEMEAHTAQYEKDYAKYLDQPEPALKDVKLNVDLRPTKRWVQFDGEYRFANETDKPIELLHVRMGVPDSMAHVEAMNVPGAKLIKEDVNNLHKIYRFDRPLQPGASGTLTFRTVMAQRGLKSLPSNKQYWEIDVQPAKNGAYLTNLGFAPALGMSRNNFLQGSNLRRKYGLPPETPTPSLDDKRAVMRSYAGVDRINTDVTVATDADQTLIVTGEEVSNKVVGNRRIARFVSPIPTLNFITIQSGRYAVKSIDVDGVKLSVYYHPKHPMNVDRMLGVVKDALQYYQKNWGPYQYKYFRVIERPDYQGTANSAPGTVGYSERFGFTGDFRNPKDVDYLAFVTAHEFGHQYWFHQVMPGDVEGAEILTETPSQFGGIMVMKHRYGHDGMRRFLQFEQNDYLAGRRAEKTEERPLALVKKQGYIHYYKGSVVMYLLQDRFGEERVNAALRSVIDRYRFKPAPFARSVDYVNAMMSMARTPAERELINDLFYRITLYDLRAKSATVRKLPNGQYETTITVHAGKVYADGKGNEKAAPFAEPLDIGVFSANPADLAFGSGNVLSMKRVPIRSGEQKVRFVTKQKPAFAGVDSYLTYIDRNVNDNVVAVANAGS
ncbi:ABC-type transport system involved in multi-copper enzyme maturation permease subunit [Sphingopyxis panaciterrae]|uniref:ABC transporter permease/M1 family aminopeptidase n=1 Tax=Sphingopyxis panaciterrae TaxID=363841 RepID=UPI001423C51D|nr:aminopeptidase [Sphingopyxis panaciterrae]NIJ38712.1 ABC-type transport system involved in multi-copper enzyme maturation permease subunit [Sphingopyxis panaciterrae]